MPRVNLYIDGKYVRSISASRAEKVERRARSQRRAIEIEGNNLYIYSTTPTVDADFKPINVKELLRGI